MKLTQGHVGKDIRIRRTSRTDGYELSGRVQTVRVITVGMLTCLVITDFCGLALAFDEWELVDAKKEPSDASGTL